MDVFADESIATESEATIIYQFFVVGCFLAVPGVLLPSLARTFNRLTQGVGCEPSSQVQSENGGTFVEVAQYFAL